MRERKNLRNVDFIFSASRQRLAEEKKNKIKAKQNQISRPLLLCVYASKSRNVILFYFTFHFFFHLSISCFVILISDSQALELTNWCCAAFAAVCVKMWKCWIVLPLQSYCCFSLSHFFLFYGFSLSDSRRGCISEYVLLLFYYFSSIRLYKTYIYTQQQQQQLLFCSISPAFSPNSILYYIFFCIHYAPSSYSTIDIDNEKSWRGKYVSKSVWVELRKSHLLFWKIV
jgi:hypothetical protein